MDLDIEIQARIDLALAPLLARIAALEGASPPASPPPAPVPVPVPVPIPGDHAHDEHGNDIPLPDAPHAPPPATPPATPPAPPPHDDSDGHHNPPASPPAATPPAATPPATPPAASSGLVPFGDHRMDSPEFNRIFGGGVILYDSLMNNKIGGGSRVAHRLRATEGGDIVEIRPYWIAVTGGSSYAKGHGGKIRVRVYPADAAGKPNTSGTLFAEGLHVPKLVNGGWPGAKLFHTPVVMTPKATLPKGILFCIVYENIDPDSANNFICVDDAVVLPGNRPMNPWLADSELAVLRGTSSSWNDETVNPAKWQQIPNVQVKLASGVYMGQMRAEGANTRYKTRGLLLSSSHPARTRFEAIDDRPVVGISLSTAFSVGGSLSVELQDSAGKTVQRATIESAANLADLPIVRDEIAAKTTWYHRALPAPMVKGQTYYLQYTPQGSARCWFVNTIDFRAYGYKNLGHMGNFHAEHLNAGKWIGFNYSGQTKDIDNSAWRDVIHLA